MSIKNIFQYPIAVVVAVINVLAMMVQSGMRMKAVGFATEAKYMLLDENGNVKAGAILIVVGAATIFIGLYVVGELDGAINRSGWTAAQNTTYTNVLNNTFTAFNLLGISLIVIGAGLILAYLGNWNVR